MNSRVVMLCLVTALIAVSAAGLAVGMMAMHLHTERSQLRLRPVNDQRYAADNARLAPRSGRRAVVFGDSRVTHWSPPLTLPGVEFLWRGVCGESTAQMRYRFAQDALNVDATDIVIEAGINDLLAGVAIGKGDDALAGAERNLRLMTQAGAAAGADVYLLTVVRPAAPPLWRRPVWSDSIYGLVARLNTELRSLDGTNIHVIDADRLLADGNRPLPSRYAEDTVHFSTAGYSVLNSTLSARMTRSDHAVQ